jgi:hypothetical protein
VPVRGGADIPDPAAVAQDGLAAVEERLGIFQEHLHEAPLRRARSANGKQGFPADEPARLVPRHREPKADIEWRIGVVDVEAVVAVRLLEAEAAMAPSPTLRKPTAAPASCRASYTVRARSAETCSSQPSSPTYVTRIASTRA